ncbi:MAG: integrin alpha [Phycisphaerales bacterium]|nr:integrin alpha [Phycisphaerales bacterium]
MLTHRGSASLRWSSPFSGGGVALAQTTVTTPTILGPDLGEGYGPQFGHAMATGDFDGDGKRDVAVSTWEMMSAQFPNNNGDGHVYVYEYDSGWSSSPIEVEIASTVPQDCVFFGYAMVAANLDGDSSDELVVSAPGGEGAGTLENGAVYIYDWDSQTSAFVLTHKFRSDPAYGGQQGDNFGWSITLADFNGDDDLDLIVGTRYWSECEENGTCLEGRNGILEDWTGAVYVFDHDGWVISSSGWNEVQDADLVIRGEQSWSPSNPNTRQTRGYFGARVASVGDLNGDGYDDFIASATRRTPESLGGACVTELFDWKDPETGQWVEDEYLEDDCRVGKVYLFAGASTYPQGEQDAYDYAKIVFTGENAEDKFGQTLASQGDLNGDGVTDIVIASNLHTETAQSSVGRVYVFLMPNYSAGWPSEGGKVWEAANANIKIDGPTNDNYVLFGYALACNGNTNKGTGEGRDSRADLIVGAPRGKSCTNIDISLREDRGFAYLFRYTGSMSVGESGGHETWAAIANSAAYYRIECENDYAKASPWLGRSLTFIGDLDNDADDDDEILIGCPGWDTTDVANGADPDDRGGVYMILH